MLCIAPQLVYLSVDEEIKVTDDVFTEIIEMIGGRTLVEFVSCGPVDMTGVSPTSKEKYECQKQLFSEICRKRMTRGYQTSGRICLLVVMWESVLQNLFVYLSLLG